MAEAAPLLQPHEVASAIVATGTEDPAFPFPLPRVTIRFCTQLTIQHNSVPASASPSEASTFQTRVLWDRKTDGGFPETKELKRRVRDVIEPGRNLGHVDRDHPRPAATEVPAAADTTVMTDHQQGGQTGAAAPPPPGPRWPTSGSSQAAAEGGNTTNPDPIRRGHSRPMIPAEDGPAQGGGSGGVGNSDEYQPKMPRGGVKPVVKPPGEARNAEVRAKLEKSQGEDEGSRKEECEDCQ
ncbi:hypothetical protein E8E14_013403 [Neopestalotiopsis sp. 37M]|nr:hypothetical protein E8E14_013403 [Neopestalotiopsis sp. 37M]